MCGDDPGGGTARDAKLGAGWEEGGMDDVRGFNIPTILYRL